MADPYCYGNTTLPADFNPVANGWTLAPYCDFTPDAICDFADGNRYVAREHIDRMDQVDNDTIDAVDIMSGSRSRVSEEL